MILFGATARYIDHLEREVEVLRAQLWKGYRPPQQQKKRADEAACEGHAGIHASLRPVSFPGCTYTTITGRVRGYGRYVLGTRGWRAERVVIDYLRVPADIYDEVKGPLSERYQCEVRKQYR